jgi:hypothetical protein
VIVTRDRVIAFLILLLFAAQAGAQTLTWEDTTSPWENQSDGFIVYHCAGGAGCVPATPIGTVMVMEYPVTTKIFAAQASATEPGKTNCFAVTAFNAIGESPKSNIACSTAAPLLPPNAPSGLTLKWNGRNIGI